MFPSSFSPPFLLRFPILSYSSRENRDSSLPILPKDILKEKFFFFGCDDKKAMEEKRERQEKDIAKECTSNVNTP